LQGVTDVEGAEDLLEDLEGLGKVRWGEKKEDERQKEARKRREGQSK
jgi:hypothetical protein